MRLFLAAACICLCLLLTGAVILAGIQFASNRSLLKAKIEADHELQTARVTIDELTHQSEERAAELSELKATTDTLRSRIEQLESGGQADPVSLPRPYRVRAFVGQESVGHAWVIPSNARKDPETGQYTYEPVLWFDESARKTFTEYRTNVVEKPVQTAQVNNYYPDDRYWNYPLWGWWDGTPPLPPVDPTPPVQPTPLPSVSPGRSAHSINANLFAPGLSRVNTRPQVLSQPAISPINARVFSPIP